MMSKCVKCEKEKVAIAELKKLRDWVVKKSTNEGGLRVPDIEVYVKKRILELALLLGKK